MASRRAASATRCVHGLIVHPQADRPRPGAVRDRDRRLHRPRAAARDLQDPVSRRAAVRRRLSALGARRRRHRHRPCRSARVLSLPAIWQGASVARALAQTLAIVKSRLVEAMLLLVVLGLICFVVGLIVFGVLMAGLVPTLGLSLSIVGFAGFGSEEMMTMAQGYALDGHAIAGLFGGLLLWAVAGVAGRPGLSARPVAGLPARHRRPRPERIRGCAASGVRRRQAACRRARRQGAWHAPAPLAATASSAFERSAALLPADHERVDDHVTTMPARGARPRTTAGAQRRPAPTSTCRSTSPLAQ